MVRAVKGKTPRIDPSAFVSEGAYVVGDVVIGEKSSIWPGAVLRGDLGRITIGAETAVEDGCVIHSGSPDGSIGDVEIGKQVVVGHGAVLHGRRIGDNVLIGINAIILHNAEIGNACIIAAGTLVEPGVKIPDHSFVLGSPCKIKGKPTEKQLWWAFEGYKDYCKLARQYREEGL
jgi:carbonic anhydrase/acetyltransferase-like protein (isoleucine patch superfamily)